MENRNRLLTLLDLLNRETDEEHPITVTEIIDRLKDAGLTANRQTIYSDIETLQAHGYDIICNKRTQNQYFIGNRDFDLAELTLLVDAVQAAKFISVKRSKNLIKKLSALASVHQADKLNRQLYVDKQIKSANEKILYTVDLLHSAISKYVKITFQYLEYTVQKKKLPKHGGKVYVFSPYALLWNNDNYYVLGYCDIHEKVVTFRVDKITVPKITALTAAPKPKGFKVEQYTKAVFLMYGGDETETVTLRCKNELMGAVIDRFGEKIKTEAINNEYFTAEVEVSVSNTFFGWLVGFGGKIKIAAPESVKKRYSETLRLVLENPQ